MNKSMYVLSGQYGIHYTKGLLDYVDVRVTPGNPQALRHVTWLLDRGIIDYTGASAYTAFRKFIDAAEPDTYNVVRFRIRDWRVVPDISVRWIHRIAGRMILRRYQKYCYKRVKKGGKK